MYIALMFHVLAAVIWIGGMFFAYVLLRPALGDVEQQQRLRIWAGTLGRFFPWVWTCIFVLLISGFMMIYYMGGFDVAGLHVYLMAALALIMIFVFKFIYLAPFRHLCRGVEEGKWEVAAYAIGTIRKLVGFNLLLGILTIVCATALKGWAGS